MSLTVFPGLNRATTDQMAEGTTNTGNGQSSSANGSIGVLPTTDNGIVDNTDSSASDGAEGTAGSGSSGSVSPAPKPSEAALEKVLTEPSLSGIINSDSRSKIFVLDQDYTAVGDNGLTAKFIFNTSADAPFRSVRAEIKLDEMVVSFAPTNAGVLIGKTNDGLDLFTFSGQTPYVFDSIGKKWAETSSKNTRIVIQVTIDKNGVDVKEITLSLNSAN
jgi:hypothetical protein